MHHRPLESLYDLFEHRRLPRLVYITKQDYSNQLHVRTMHAHDEICEILLIFQGMGVYRINGMSFAIEKGTLLYCNQDETHELTTSLDKEIGCYCIGLTDLRLKDLPENHIVSPRNAFFGDCGDLLPLLCALCEYLYQNAGQDGDASATFMLTYATFLSLMLDLRQPFRTESSATPEFQLANHIRKYIDKHFRENLTLARMSEDLNCSAPYISHVFKDIMGYSPIQYLSRLRIGLAQNYLISTDYSVMHIATLVGYDNSNYFNTVFTKMIGLSPMKYRKRYLESMRGQRLQ